MKYIRLIFVILVLAVVGAGLFQLRIFDSLPPLEPVKVPGFQITMISGNGQVYSDADMTRPVTEKTVAPDNNVALYADAQAAFEFCFNRSLFCAMPGSSLRYTALIRELNLIEGDFFWKRNPEGSIQEILVSRDGLSFLLAGEGRVRINGRRVEIWNYLGKAGIQANDGMLELDAGNYIVLDQGRRVKELKLAARPGQLLPEDVEIKLRKSGDSAVRFSWSPVDGVSHYLLKIYTSPLREEILVRKRTETTRVGVDLGGFKGRYDFYYDITGVSRAGQMPGIPSETRHIALSGVLLGDQSRLKPPELKISSLTVGGNIILIKGEVEENSQLFINNQPVKLDLDGKFIHTLTFKTIGVKEIVFRVISPAELETVVRRRVAIFEEGV